MQVLMQVLHHKLACVYRAEKEKWMETMSWVGSDATNLVLEELWA